MKSYDVYYVKLDDLAELERRAGGERQLRLTFSRADKVPGSEWLACNYRDGASPPADEILSGEASLAGPRSAKFGEVIYIFANMPDSLVYEHALDGKMLRKLVWFPLLGPDTADVDDDWTPGWLCAEGEPEPWEASIFFRPERLAEAIEWERENYADRGKSDRFSEREAAIRKMWDDRIIAASDILPSCDGTVAFAIEKHFGIPSPAKQQR